MSGSCQPRAPFWRPGTTAAARNAIVYGCVGVVVLLRELTQAHHNPGSCCGQTDRDGESVSRENIPTALRLRGRVNMTALEDALAYLVKRHEALRAKYVLQHGVPLQVCKPVCRSDASDCNLLQTVNSPGCPCIAIALQLMTSCTIKEYSALSWTCREISVQAWSCGQDPMCAGDRATQKAECGAQEA